MADGVKLLRHPIPGADIAPQGLTSAAGCPQVERPVASVPSRIKGSLPPSGHRCKHPQLAATPNSPRQQGLGCRVARQLSASLAPGHMGLGPHPRHRVLTTAPHSSSQGSHLRSFPIPTPAASLGPRAQPQLLSSYSAPTSAQRHGGLEAQWEPCHQQHGNRTTGLIRRAPSPGGQPVLSSFPARNIQVTKEPRPGIWRRAGAQGTPGAGRTPFPLPDKPHASPFPRLSKQAGSEAMFGAGAARRELPILSQAALARAARGSRPGEAGPPCPPLAPASPDSPSR